MTRDFTLLFSNLSLYSISRRIRIIRLKREQQKIYISMKLLMNVLIMYHKNSLREKYILLDSITAAKILPG